MALDPTINFGKVLVSTGYDDTAVSIVLNAGDGARLPDPATAGAFNLVWWNWTDYPDPSDDPNREIVRCTARSTDTLTVTRGQEGIAATTKNSGGKTYKMILALTAYQMGLVIAQGGNSFGAGMVIGSNDAQIVYVRYNGTTSFEVNAAGINLYSPRTIYTSGGDLWFGLTSAHNLKFNTNNIERARIEANGHFLIGTTGGGSTAPRLRVVRNDAGGSGTYFSNQIAAFWGTDAGIAVVSIGVGGTNPYLCFFHNATSASSPTASSAGNFLGGMQVYGHNGTTYAFGGYVQLAASAGGAWSATNYGTELWVRLTPINSTTAATRFVIKGSGEATLTGDGTSVTEGATPMFTIRSTKTPIAGIGTPTNFHLMLLHPVNTNGATSGVAFSISSDTSNVGAAIIHYRVSSNSQGRLLFYTKASTTAAAAPVLGMIIDEAQNIKIGSTNGTAAARLHVVGTDVTTSMLEIDRYSDNEFSANIRLRKARGTEASPTAISSGDALANIGGLGYHSGGAFETSCPGLIAIVATEAHSATAFGTRINFSVTPNTTTTTAVRMMLDQNGKLSIGFGTAPSARCHIQEATLGDEVHRIETVATNDDVSEKVHQGRVETTDATVTTILTLATIADSVKSISVRVVARRTAGAGGTAGDVAGYSRIATFKNIAGTVTQVGTTTDDHTAEDQSGWDVTFSISGTNVLIQVTGAADNTITWHATARTYELST